MMYYLLRLNFKARIWLFEQFTLTGIGILVCLMIAAFIGLESTESMSHLLFFLALALLGVAMVSRRFIHYRFKVHRILPRFGTLHQPLRYRVVLQNLMPERQKGLKFADACSFAYPSVFDFIKIKRRYKIRRLWAREWRKHVARQQWAIATPMDLPVLPPRTKTEVEGEVLPVRRGRLSFEGVTLICPDPLGLMNKRLTYALPQSVCILPQRYVLPPLNLANLRTHQMGEAVLTNVVGEALEFRSLRDYRPGDPTNKIHWKSWAKVGRPITKEQQDESAVHHALILDTFQAEPESDIFEEAIAIAVSYLMQDQGEESLLDVIFADQKPRCSTVGRDLKHREQILETLATMMPCQDLSLDSLNPIVQTRLPRLSSCLCIFLDFNEPRQKFLKRLIQSGIPIKVLVLRQRNIDHSEALGTLLSPHCRIHFISMSQIQEDLLQI